jgi:DNA modification methylase
LLLIEGDNVESLRSFVLDASVQLTVTSPPYDNLRTYNGFTWDFESVARELFRVTKPGGVVVWIVGDETIDGDESGSSFKQALYFKEIGFKLNDTMIWDKASFSAVGALTSRYAPVFEYMFVFTKGKLKVFNPIKDKPNKWYGRAKIHGTVRQPDGSRIATACMGNDIKEFGQRHNIWEVSPERNSKSIGHPAFLGSGTTGKMAILNDRDFIGCEISSEYMAIARERILEAQFRQTIRNAERLVSHA